VAELKRRNPVSWRFYGSKLWVQHVPFLGTKPEEMLIYFRFDGDDAIGPEASAEIEKIFNVEIRKLLTAKTLIVNG
jgi:hypothetical protein